jgi:hypothetical protein
MNVISRYFIGDNFSVTNLPDGRTAGETHYTKSDLIEKIKLWKYILKYKCKAQPQESIIIGNQNLNVDYLAIIFASAELSLQIVVIDYVRSDNFQDLDFEDPKTKVLSPIDIFIHDLPKSYSDLHKVGFAKFSFFTKYCKRTYSIYEDINYEIEDLNDFEIANNIFPNPKDILIRSTSSGTTDTPKIVEHTHEFIHSVSTRNKFLYEGTALHVKNLNHGATAAVTLFPALASDNVKNHLIYSIDEDSDLNNFIEALTKFKDDINTVSFPYPYLVEKFINASKEKNIKWPNLKLITLSYIIEYAKTAIRDGVFKSIVSIFGSNETLGPIFINVIDKTCWNKESKFFEQYDDYYKSRLDHEGKLTVTLPVYNTEFAMNDCFKQEGKYFVYQGRSDLVRINGESFKLDIIHELNKRHEDFYVVVDILNHCLYLAYWELKTQQEINNYIEKIESNFSRIKVTKVSHLLKENFYYGVKIDNELLREYFRLHIN